MWVPTKRMKIILSWMGPGKLSVITYDRGVRVEWVSIKRPRLHLKRDLFYVHRNGVYYFPATLFRSETVVNGD